MGVVLVSQTAGVRPSDSRRCWKSDDSVVITTTTTTRRYDGCYLSWYVFTQRSYTFYRMQINPRAKALDRGGDKPSKASLSSKGEDQKRKTEYLVKVHFDAFTSRWDESYGEQEWREKKLQPLFTKVRRSAACFRMDALLRKLSCPSCSLFLPISGIGA